MTHTSPALMVTVPHESGLDLLLQLHTKLVFCFFPALLQFASGLDPDLRLPSHIL